MAKVRIQIRIDEDLKKAAEELFAALGIDMSCAVSMFLHQCVVRGGIPFPIETPRPFPETLEAMAEAKRISSDPSVKGYTNMDELNAALSN